MVKKRNEQPSTCPDGWLKAGIKVPVHLTVRQQKYAARCVGIARAVYNQMVATHQMGRAHGKGWWPSPMELEKTFNALKHETDFGMKYATKVSRFVAQGACRDFRRAYENWRNPDLRAGKPSFKKKNRNGTGSFLAASGKDRIQHDGSRRIRLPYLGSLKLKRELPEGTPYEVRIKKQNGKWYASINYWRPPVIAEGKTHVFGGVDVGQNPLAVDSELVHYQNPKPLDKHLRKLRCWQRASARRIPGSGGSREAQRRIGAIHRRITGLRENAHNQLSRLLIRKYAVLAVESLNVAGMDKLRHQARSIRDAATGGLLQKIRYKADWYGTIILEASRSFPSSKLCSSCGYCNNDLDREAHWNCPQCGIRHDRNENAALNLLGLALKAADELPDKFILGPVGPDVTLPDGKALADGKHAAGETGPNEGRTAPSTRKMSAVDGETDGDAVSRPGAPTQIQLRLAI